MEKKELWGTKGVVIHLTKTDDGTEPLENIAKHIDASKHNPYGQFYFSCGYHFDDLSDVDYLLLYCNSGQRKHDFFVAKISDKSISYPDPFIPDNATIYSPENWADVPERTWFMLNNLKLFINSDELKQLIVTSEGRETKLLDRIKSELPLGRCYVSGPLFL